MRSSAGFYIQSVSPDKVDATSEGLYIYGSQSVGLVSAGDLVSLSGTVSEYASDETYLHLTEVTFPTNVTVLSSGHTVAPVVLGVDRTPPGSVIYVKDQFELTPPVDVEQDGDKLKEKKRGLDFWESLENMLVKVPNPRALGRTDYYNELWIVGADYATHANARGGLTTNVYPGGWDSNPEAIVRRRPPLLLLAARASPPARAPSLTPGLLSPRAQTDPRQAARRRLQSQDGHHRY